MRSRGSCDVGLGAHSAVMPEVENSRAARRLPPPALVDPRRAGRRRARRRAGRRARSDRRLWIRAARRNGAEMLYELDDDKVRAAERAILIWSGPDGETRLAAEAERLGVWGAFYLPRTPNARGVARRGPPRRTRKRPRSRTRFACSSSPATRRSRTRTCARSPSRPRTCSRSRCSSARPAASPTSCSRGRATSSARGRTSISRGACNGSAGPSCRPLRTSSRGSQARRALRRRHLAVHLVGVRRAFRVDLRRPCLLGDRRAGAAAVASGADEPRPTEREEATPSPASSS